MSFIFFNTRKQVWQNNIYKCTCCLNGGGRNDFDAGTIPYEGHWKRWASEIETFLGHEMATSEVSAIWGPKKSDFLRHASKNSVSDLYISLLAEMTKACEMGKIYKLYLEMGTNNGKMNDRRHLQLTTNTRQPTPKNLEPTTATDRDTPIKQSALNNQYRTYNK
jgi:hypothetical protein